jgi:hypothetical protein
MDAMFSKRAAVLIVFAQLAVGVALAQEYGRTSGGQLNLFTKQPNRLSGSLGISLSRSLFGSNLKGYEGTLGGTVIADRLWFFGSMQRNDTLRFASALPQIETAPATYGKVDAHLGDRQSLSAIAARTQLSTSTLSTVPASFLSMHYTGIISSNSFFTASVSQSVAHSATPSFP